MLQFKFSLFYVKEKTHFEKKKTTELTQQIVTDLSLFIMVNMYGGKHTNVFSHNHSKRNLLSPPIFLVFVMKIFIHLKQVLEVSLTTKYLQLFELKKRVRRAEL